MIELTVPEGYWQLDSKIDPGSMQPEDGFPIYLIIFSRLNDDVQSWLDEYAPDHTVTHGGIMSGPVITFYDDAQAVQFKLTFSS
jgi:hypothetical protein